MVELVIPRGVLMISNSAVMREELPLELQVFSAAERGRMLIRVRVTAAGGVSVVPTQAVQRA